MDGQQSEWDSGEEFLEVNEQFLGASAAIQQPINPVTSLTNDHRTEKSQMIAQRSRNVTLVALGMMSVIVIAVAIVIALLALSLLGYEIWPTPQGML